jgi:alkaline phosphatase
MNKALAAALLSSLVAFACTREQAGAPAQAQAQAQAPIEGAAPKVILIIGDGMDQHQITIARNYLVGYGGQLTLDTLPERSSVQTQTVAEEDPSVPEYVPDSANTATSMATGIVTSAGRIGTTAGTDRDVATIMELAKAAGFGTGIVTTSSVTDATPASFVAHVNQRLCESPRAMVTRNPTNPAFSSDCSQDLKANGGKGSIAEQIAASDVDVVLGGGVRNFDQLAEGEATKSVTDLAVENGFRLVRTPAELAALTRGGKVLGLFAPGTMGVQWRGASDAKAEEVARVDGRVVYPEPFTCEPHPEFATMPTLEAMARAAVAQLDGVGSFVLMIESASIDKQSHLRRPCGQIGELKQLDDTVKMVLDYARAHPETLVLVTADHSQAAQLIPETSVLAALNVASPGHFARVRTLEGAVMGINYATNDSSQQEDHSGADVPLFAFGPGAEQIPAQLRQTQVFGVMLAHLGLTPP